MPQYSPTRDGFRAVLRAPAVWLAEIAWRWSFGIGGALLVSLSLFEFLRSLRVTKANELFLRSNNPWLISTALADIFQGSGPRLLRIAAVLLPALAILWTFAAGLGRAATLKYLLAAPVVRLRGLLGLSFLRAAVTLAAVIGFFGAVVFAGDAGAGPAENPALATSRLHYAIVIFLGLGVAVVCAWAVLNWMLALAAIFAARDRRDSLSALAEALRLLRRHTGQIFATSTWFGLLHLIALVGVTYVGFLVIVLAAISGWAAAAVAILGAAFYFAIVDFLYIARLAAYVAIAGPHQSVATAPTNAPEPILPAQA